MSQPKIKKSFWQRPEGITGAIFLGFGLIGGGLLLATALPTLIELAQNTVYLFGMIAALAGIVFVALDSKTRALVGFIYKSVMRWITGIFVQMDPIGILKNYIEDLKGNLKKMNRQVAKLRGQMHKLNELIFKNNKQIQENLELAKKAQGDANKNVMILKSRKAGRLKDSNMRLSDLYGRMELLYRVLNKMYSNSGVMLEDLEDQVEVKEQERKAIHASHSAMSSAMSILKGDANKRYMFDQALEAITNDVSMKVGEMEQFMDMSASIMDNIDLQNGVFEEEGLEMLKKWELQSDSLILGDDKELLLLETEDENNILDLNEDLTVKEKSISRTNQYDNFFE